MGRRLLVIACLLVGAVVLFSSGLLCGALIGEFGTKQNRFRREKEVIGRVLAEDPAYSRVEVIMFTGDGSAYLMGSVPTEGDRDRLRAKLTKLLGESREVDLTAGVDAK